MTAHEPDPSTEAAADPPTREQLPADDPEQADPDPTDPEPEGSAPEGVAPEGSAPEKAEPEEAEPEDAVPEDAVPEDAEPEDAEPEEAEPEEAEAQDAEAEDTEAADDAPPVGPIDDEDPDDLELEVVGEGDYLDEDEEPGPAGFDKRRDVYLWILVPLATLVLGPALAASVMFFVAESTNGYPGICASARGYNGCEEAILRMADLHVVAFLAGWLLLWALPWWRGLRAYRIGLGVVLALVLVAIPLRLIHTVQLGDVY